MSEIKSAILLIGRYSPSLESLRSFLAKNFGEQSIFVIDEVNASLKYIEEQNVELVLIDSSMQEGNILWAIAQIKTNKPSVQCVLLSDRTSLSRLALYFGADQAICYTIPDEELIKSIETLWMVKT